MAQFLTYDDGIGMILHRFRLWVGKKAAQTKRVAFWHSLADSLYCVYCTGYLCSPIFLVLILIPTIPGNIFLIWFGIMGGQAMIEGFAPRISESIRKDI